MEPWPNSLVTAIADVLSRLRVEYPAGRRLTYYSTDLVQLRGFYQFHNDMASGRPTSSALASPLSCPRSVACAPDFSFALSSVAHASHSPARPRCPCQ